MDVRRSKDHYTRILARRPRPDEDILDAVYENYAQSSPFLPVTHFTDHATMGSEALVGLGLGRRVEPWIARHPEHAYRAASTGIEIRTRWATALGRSDCHGDWLIELERELREERFEDVLARWVPRFAHQVGTLLFHGLIRTGHAVRALDHRDTPARRGELARGLALWAIGIKSPPPADRTDSAERRAPEVEIPRFAKAAAAAFINDPSIPNVHLLTGAMAYLLIADHLDAGVHRIALASFSKTHAKTLANLADAERRAWGAPTPPLDDRELERLSGEADPHPIKLTEAALRAYELTEEELFLKAAGRTLDSSGIGPFARGREVSTLPTR
jgi:hypothetical protein